jgi:hypothetical protein
MTRRILHLRKKTTEDMPTFQDRLEKQLSEIGLEDLGRFGRWTSGGSRFPSTHGFESIGEGGFVVEYEENKKTYTEHSNRDTTETDATIIPIGATGSLVERTFKSLYGQQCPGSGDLCYEKRV